MKIKLKISKVVVIAITLVIITSISMSNIVVPVQADTLAYKVSSPYLQSSGPRGPEGQPLMDVATIVMPLVDTQKLLEEDTQRASDQPPRFATSINVQINPATDGTWETLADGIQLWRLHIISSDAISLNMGFTTYNMPPGGQLYLYTPDYSQLVGPFTEQDNEEYGELWTPIVEGAEVVLEVSLPASEASQLQLELTSVNHGYVDFDTAEKSGSCNLDVVCSQGDPWRSEIRSVGRYTISGSFLCTGALINNTSQNFTPYFLTANHCLDTSPEAASVVVYWNYECPTCRTIGSAENGTPISTAGFPTQSGAFLRATYTPSDMTLLELDSPVSSSVNAFWSGWDRSGANATSAVAIHHPQGHEKRISFENNATTITSYAGTSVPGDGTHIRITDWDLGTTEGGSSGSPLFDQNHRIFGQLHGGLAACGNNESDWYGRLFTSWTGGGTNSTRLSNWLDPTNTGAVTLNGASIWKDSVGVFRPSNGVIFLKNTNTTGFADIALNYGLGGDYPVTGDWNGDGTDTIGVYRNGSFYLRNFNTIGFADLVFAFGSPGDQPIAGDWNGDGIDTIGVYRSGTFFLRNSNSTGAPSVSFGLGNPGDVGIAGDWNGDGSDTTGVFRPSNGVIFLKNTNTTGFADIALNYGLAGDQPIIGDWNNDGIDTIGVYRNAQFLLRNSNTIGFADLVFALGIPGDMPIAGNWDGIP